jgi:replication factor C subunit 2/4
MNTNTTVWVEKYRPYNINKIIQPDIKQLIYSNNNLSDLPHLLFYGHSGTGKTTTALAICKHIYTSNPANSHLYKQILKERILELNASDERGIKVVRDKIKTFAAQALNTYADIPFFKIIILDEADVMNNDSQFALRRIIEQYSHITRFILICNYVTKIIPPLASRCSKYKFDAVHLSKMKTIIENIFINEKVNYNQLILDKINQQIYYISKGDLRKTITMLQRAVYIANLNKINLNIDIINEISGMIPNKFIQHLYLILITKMDTYDQITKNLMSILNNGYPASNIINELSLIILNDKNILDTNKSLIFIKMSNICNLLSNGSGDYIQLLVLCSYINYTLTKIID